MSYKQYVILFSQLAKYPPRLYKKKLLIQKCLKQKPYKIMNSFDNELQAQNSFQIYKLQHKKYILIEQQKKLQDKIKILQQNSTIKTNLGSNYQKQNHSLKKQNKILLDKLSNKEKKSSQTLINKQNIQSSNKDQKQFINLQVKNQKAKNTKNIQNDDTSQKNNKKKSQNNTKQNIMTQQTKLLILQKKKSQIHSYIPNLNKHTQNHICVPFKNPVDQKLYYTGFFDGASKNNPGPSGIGYVVSQAGTTLYQGRYYLGVRTNNQTQFTALIYLLLDCYINGVTKIKIFGDSKLVIQMFKGVYQTRSTNLIQLCQIAKNFIHYFDQIQIQHVNRDYNTHADRLSNQAFRKKYKEPSLQLALLGKQKKSDLLI